MPSTCVADVVAVDGVDVQAIEERRCRRDALFLVIDRSNAPVDERRRRRLAEIVGDGGEHERELLRPIADRRRACAPDRRPAACAPTRRLPGATPAPVDSRRAPTAPETAFRRCRGRARAPSPPMDAAPAAASRSLPRRVRPEDRRAESIRQSSRALRRPASNANRAANCTARSTRRLSSGKVAGSTTRRSRRARSSRPSERIEILVGERIPGDGVDREVAPSRGLLDGHRRIAGDVKPLVPASRLRLSAGQGHVDDRRACRPESLRRPPRRGRNVSSSARRRSAGTPNTSMSTFAAGETVPRRRSRTHPPTISARPPASRTASAICVGVLITESVRGCFGSWMLGCCATALGATDAGAKGAPASLHVAP